MELTRVETPFYFISISTLHLYSLARITIHERY